jgi:hypothetical protein
MLPDCFVCTSCREIFPVPFQTAYYYIGSLPLAARIDDTSLLAIPLRPAWCKDCHAVAPTEDILALREIEAAYGAVRSGRTIEYPLDTTHCSADEARAELTRYLQWRMARRHSARALCCGGTNFQFMDVAQPLLRHADCEYGFIEARIQIDGGCGGGPGTRAPANIPIYSTEGELLALLTWWKSDSLQWEHAAAAYAPAVHDNP